MSSLAAVSLCYNISTPTDISFQLQQNVEVGKDHYHATQQHLSCHQLCVNVFCLSFSHHSQMSTYLSLHLKCGSERNLKMTYLETQLTALQLQQRRPPQLQEVTTTPQSGDQTVNQIKCPPEDIYTKSVF